MAEVSSTGTVQYIEMVWASATGDVAKAQGCLDRAEPTDGSRECGVRHCLRLVVDVEGLEEHRLDPHDLSLTPTGRLYTGPLDFGVCVGSMRWAARRDG